MANIVEKHTAISPFLPIPLYKWTDLKAMESKGETYLGVVHNQMEPAWFFTGSGTQKIQCQVCSIVHIQGKLLSICLAIKLKWIIPETIELCIPNRTVLCQA